MIEKLYPITAELAPCGGLTDFQEDLLCAAAEWADIQAELAVMDAVGGDYDGNYATEAKETTAWIKFRKLLALATKKKTKAEEEWDNLTDSQRKKWSQFFSEENLWRFLDSAAEAKEKAKTNE